MDDLLPTTLLTYSLALSLMFILAGFARRMQSYGSDDLVLEPDAVGLTGFGTAQPNPSPACCARWANRSMPLELHLSCARLRCISILPADVVVLVPCRYGFSPNGRSVQAQTYPGKHARAHQFLLVPRFRSFLSCKFCLSCIAQQSG